MEITIYTSNGCSWCVRMRELLKRAKLKYTEINWQNLSGDEQQEVSKKYPQMSSFPVAIVDGEYVGGLVPVAKMFLEKGLVSAPQK